jgi:hypothetical protein
LTDSLQKPTAGEALTAGLITALLEGRSQILFGEDMHGKFKQNSYIFQELTSPIAINYKLKARRKPVEL